MDELHDLIKQDYRELFDEQPNLNEANESSHQE
jgi:hypothetical protein